MRTGIIVCAAGCGSRVGGEIPKQFIYIGNKCVIDYTLDNIFSSKVFNDIIIMIRPEDFKTGVYSKYVSRGAWLVKGDEENGQETRKLGLEFCKFVLGYKNNDLIGIADGNRPFIDSEFYRRLVEDAKEYGTSIPYVIQKEVLVLKDGDKTFETGHNRNEYLATMAPCFFPFGVLYDAYDIAKENGTLDNSEGQVRVVMDKLTKMNIRNWLHYVEGKSIYFKITTPDDVEMAKLLMFAKENKHKLV